MTRVNRLVNEKRQMITYFPHFVYLKILSAHHNEPKKIFAFSNTHMAEAFDGKALIS